MMLSTAHRRIMLDATPDVIRAKGYLPTACEFSHEGKSFVAFEHSLLETRILRDLGYNVPSPILHYYDWPGMYRPMEHQAITAAFLTLHPRAFVLNGIGTGKTLATIWAADYLMRIGLIRRCIIVAPLSTLVRVHGEAVFKHFPERSHAILHGSKQDRIRLLNCDFHFYIINHDGATGLAQHIHDREDLDLMVLDEIQVYRNGNTSRWKTARKMIRDNQWVWALSGGPTPNEPTDAFSEAKLVNPDGPVNRYRSFTDFKSSVMSKHGPFTWIPRPEANDRVFDILQPAIRYSSAECLDLPPCTVQTLEVELTVEQKKAYKDLVQEFSTEINGAQVTALNEAIKVMRLVQVISGTLYDVAGVKHAIPAGPRLSVVKEIIESADQKVIVFCPFTGNLQPLVDALSKLTTCAMVYGDTNTRKRDEIFEQFQSSTNPRVLVAHPQCMAHGLTLTSAATIIWWAPINSHDIYDQANGRINRKGQDHPTTIVHISGTAVERKMYKRLEEKGKFQGILLDMVQEAKAL